MYSAKKTTNNSDTSTKIPYLRQSAADFRVVHQPFRERLFRRRETGLVYLYRGVLSVRCKIHGDKAGSRNHTVERQIRPTIQRGEYRGTRIEIVPDHRQSPYPHLGKVHGKSLSGKGIRLFRNRSTNSLKKDKHAENQIGKTQDTSSGGTGQTNQADRETDWKIETVESRQCVEPPGKITVSGNRDSGILQKKWNRESDQSESDNNPSSDSAGNSNSGFGVCSRSCLTKFLSDLTFL